MKCYFHIIKHETPNCVIALYNTLTLMYKQINSFNSPKFRMLKSLDYGHAHTFH